MAPSPSASGPSPHTSNASSLEANASPLSRPRPCPVQVPRPLDKQTTSGRLIEKATQHHSSPRRTTDELGQSAKASRQPSPAREPGTSHSSQVNDDPPQFHPHSQRSNLEADVIFFDLFAGLGSASTSLKWAGLDESATYIIEAGLGPAAYLPNLLRQKFPLATVWQHIEELTNDDHRLLKKIVADHQKKNPRVTAVVFGGFPCQDLTCKGAGRGLQGSRSSLVGQLLSIILKLNDLGINTWFCAENVASMAPPQRQLLEKAFGISASAVDSNLWYPTHRARLLFTNIPHARPVEDNLIKQHEVLEPGWTTAAAAGFKSTRPSHSHTWRTFMRAIGPGEPPEHPSDYWHFSFVGYGVESLLVKDPLSPSDRTTVLKHLQQGEAFTSAFNLNNRAKLVKWIHEDGGSSLLRPLCSIERGRALGYSAQELYRDGNVPTRFSEADWHASTALGNCLSPRMTLHICSGLKNLMEKQPNKRPQSGPPREELHDLNPDGILKKIRQWQGASHR